MRHFPPENFPLSITSAGIHHRDSFFNNLVNLGFPCFPFPTPAEPPPSVSYKRPHDQATTPTQGTVLSRSPTTTTTQRAVAAWPGNHAFECDAPYAAAAAARRSPHEDNCWPGRRQTSRRVAIAASLSDGRTWSCHGRRSVASRLRPRRVRSALNSRDNSRKWKNYPLRIILLRNGLLT